ncbi:MAG: twin-arginine translocase TatA/TatE family subunit [Acidaminococcaceae bacterium]|jgi:sec-independent protein translocase protein TatA|nr:twin-arginine translocase TatA/TatE family subunit [Acidaminococcaceae bacterium]
MRLGTTEILLIIAVACLVFGSGKLAGLGKSLGTSIREFKQEIKQETEPVKEGEAGGQK